MRLETHTPWEGVTNFSGDRVQRMYVPVLAKIADRYRIPMRSHDTEDEPEWFRTSDPKEHRLLVTYGDSPRAWELTPRQMVEVTYEIVLIGNYPG